jgi:hypothetical protein
MKSARTDPPGEDASPGDAVDLDLFELSRRLQQAGWDAFLSELTGEVAARQDQRPDRAVWAVVIDRSGRWRCTITRPVRVATARKLPAGRQAVHLLDETRQITTITGTLRQAADLPELLAGLEKTA